MSNSIKWRGLTLTEKDDYGVLEVSSKFGKFTVYKSIDVNNTVIWRARSDVAASSGESPEEALDNVLFKTIDIISEEKKEIEKKLIVLNKLKNK